MLGLHEGSTNRLQHRHKTFFQVYQLEEIKCICYQTFIDQGRCSCSKLASHLYRVSGSNSKFASYVIAAIFVAFNKRFVFSLFCLYHQHGRHVIQSQCLLTSCEWLQITKKAVLYLYVHTVQNKMIYHQCLHSLKMPLSVGLG